MTAAGRYSDAAKQLDRQMPDTVLRPTMCSTTCMRAVTMTSPRVGSIVRGAISGERVS